MDNSEELKNLTFNNKFQAGKNHSESDVRLKRLSIIPEDEAVDADLRVVGFSVKVDGDKAYSFDVEKTRSRSADTFTALDSSNRIFGLNASASYRDECRGVRNFFEVPNVDEQFLNHGNLTNIESSERVNSPVLQVCDSVDKSSMTVNCLPPMMVVDNKNSKVCLCNGCYSRVQSVLDEKRKRISHQGSEMASLEGGKLSGMVKEPLTSTSPKIKCKKFDYMSTDAWRPYEDTQDDFLSGKIEATNIFHVGDSDSDESVESRDDIDLNSACETVNDHLLNLQPVDKDTVRRAAAVLHKAWFEAAASKHSDTEEVKYYFRYFEEFSDNLLRTLLYSVDNNGNNILHFAFANNRFDLVEEILKNKFSAELLKKTNKSGNSPLMICAISSPKTESDWSVIRKCMQQGDVNSKSLKSGQTPLMNAASCGFHEMVDVLLDVGANPNLQDKDGSTALMYAAEHGHESCIRTIGRHPKCDPTIKDKDGQTACSIALSNGNKNTAVLIHMQALEKRQISKHFQSPRRYAWTNNESRNRAQRIKPVYSSEVH